MIEPNSDLPTFEELKASIRDSMISKDEARNIFNKLRYRLSEDQQNQIIHDLHIRTQLDELQSTRTIL